MKYGTVLKLWQIGELLAVSGTLNHENLVMFKLFRAIRQEETFSPAICFESVRAIALGAQLILHLHEMDVSTAFLHGKLEEEIYMRQPEGFIEEGTEQLVC